MLPPHAFSSQRRGSYRSAVIPPLLWRLTLAVILCAYGILSPALAQELNYHVLHAQLGPADGVSPTASLVEGANGNFYGTTSGGGTFNNGTIFAVTSAGALTTLYSFSGGSDGRAPSGALVLGSDGNFYGTTPSGGASNAGTVFEFTPAGSLTTLYSFTGGSGDGGSSMAALVQGSDGNFYGTTSSGGTSGAGTIFEVTPAGRLTTVHSFSGNTDGGRSVAALIQGNDGNFYGTTSGGGPAGQGTVFQCTSAGVYTVLHGFAGSDGASPMAPLVQGSDGNFYGTTSGGGADSGSGTVFEITPTGTLTIITSFSGNNGAMPQAGLVIGSNGNFYGTTLANGSGDGGTVFEVTPSGTLTTLYSFNGSNGQRPQAALVLGSDGNFYGTTFYGGSVGAGTIFAMSQAGAFTSIYSFIYGDDGSNPAGQLLSSSDGCFYGVTANGGPANEGTVYKVDRAGAQTVLADFTGNNGALPNGALVQGSDGNFYGVTEYGGASNDGTAFQMTPAGVITSIHTFSGIADGSHPIGGLILANDGYFYGVTNEGGASDEGTVFRMNTGGSLTMLHDFAGGNDGAFPLGPLVEGRDGNFYGALLAGSEGGAVFSMTPGGVVTLLHNFSYATDGYQPSGGLIQGSDGSFYGTADYDGPDGGGTLFKITSGGTFSVIHPLNPDPEGMNPPDGLTLGTDGNFYGTASGGGANNDGTIYELTAGGTFSVLYTFGATYGNQDNSDGAHPSAALVQGPDGNFYGVTQYGGAAGAGTVFVLGPAGALTLGAANYAVAENEGSVTISVSRTRGNLGAVTVAYAAADGSAVAGTDYGATSGTLSWADGDTTAKTFAVPVIDRHLNDGTARTFTVKLSAPTSNAMLGNPASATVTISANDAPDDSAPTVISSLPYTVPGPGSYVLNANLSSTQTSGNLITVNNSNVIIDFQNHTLSGPNVTSQTTIGIYASEVTNVTIQNGTIVHCNTGIYIAGNNTAATNSLNERITNMRVSKCNSFGIEFDESPASLITNCQISQIGSSTSTASAGISLYGAGVTVQGCTIGSITVASGYSSYCISSVTGSFARQNQLSSATVGLNGGIYQDNVAQNCTTAFSGGIDAGGNTSSNTQN